MKRLISLLVTAALVLSCVASTVLAADSLPDGSVPDSGASDGTSNGDEDLPEGDEPTEGDDLPSASNGGALTDSVSWSLSADGVLTLDGEGELPELSSYSEQPWRSMADRITALVVSDGISYIGAHSFELLPRLASVTLPSSLVGVGESAFERCYAIKSFKMPSSVETIGARALADCWRLAEYNIALNASSLTCIGKEAFAGCTALRTTTLPKRLVYLGDGAYLGCTSLDGIILPDKLEYLGTAAFQSCAALREINIPWQIKAVPDYAFFGCLSLESVSLGRHLESIGREAFLWCPALKSIHVPKGVTQMPDYSFGYYYFGGEYRAYPERSISTASDCAASYARRHEIELILDDAAHVCEDTCPYCALCTSDCAFLNCADKCPGHSFPITGTAGNIAWSLSEDFVLTLSGEGELADFDHNGAPWSPYKSAVRHLRVKEGVTRIGAYAFDSYDAMLDITLAKSVTSVGRKAFALCTSLVTATLSEETAEICELAFYGCSSLESVSLGKWLVTLGSHAFAGCGSLREAALPEGLSSIGDSAFEGCESLSELSVPSTVARLGARALGWYYTADRHYRLYEDFTLKGALYSAAHTYAEENGIPFVRTDIHECTEKCPVCDRCRKADCKFPECARKCDGICNAEWSSPFSDVREKDWYYDNVRYVCLAGLMNGMTKTSFEPGGSVTRAQLVLILWRLAGSPEPTAAPPATDVTAAWYRDAVAWGYESGVVTGRTATSFDPMGLITREELVTMLMRYTALSGALPTDSRAPLDAFADAERVREYAREPMAWAVAEGFVNGKNAEHGTTLLAPRTGATRAECAAVFERFLKRL